MGDEHRAATSGANVEARDVFGSVFAANISRLTSEQQALFTDLFRQMLSEQRPGGIVNVAMGVGATATTVSEVPYTPPDASAMMEVIRQSFQTFYAKPWGLPDKNETFAGRQAELAQLRSGLLREGTACVSSREEGTKTLTSETTQDRTAAAQESTAAGESKRKAILGPGGFGKTQLAIACAYELANEYHFVIYFHGSRELLSRDIRRLARETGFGFRDDTPVESIAKSLYWLLGHLPKVLFIIDDVERLNEVKGLLPPKDNPHFHCLYTSRRQDIWKRHFKSGFERILLGVFTPEESIDYFDKVASPELKSQNAEAENHVQWRILSEKLGHLPLALSQAMAYLNTHCSAATEEGESLLSYIAQYDENFSVFGSCAPDDSYQQTILTTWMITLPKLLKRSWFAVELFFSLAYLWGEDISIDIVRGYCESREGLPVPMKRDPSIKTQLKFLKDYSLITHLDSSHIEIHQMVQQAIIWWLSDDNSLQRGVAASSYTGESGEESDDGEEAFRTCTVDTSREENVPSYPRQLEKIARYIEQAKAKGCVTEPHQLIRSIGKAITWYNVNFFCSHGFPTLISSDYVLSHLHRVVQMILLQSQFMPHLGVRLINDGGRYQDQDRLLVFFIAAISTRVSMTTEVEFLICYTSPIKKLLELGIKSYVWITLELIKLFLIKISSQVRAVELYQKFGITKWLQYILENAESLLIVEELAFWQQVENWLNRLDEIKTPVQRIEKHAELAELTASLLTWAPKLFLHRCESSELFASYAQLVGRGPSAEEGHEILTMVNAEVLDKIGISGLQIPSSYESNLALPCTNIPFINQVTLNFIKLCKDLSVGSVNMFSMKGNNRHRLCQLARGNVEKGDSEILGLYKKALKSVILPPIFRMGIGEISSLGTAAMHNYALYTGRFLGGEDFDIFLQADLELDNYHAANSVAQCCLKMGYYDVAFSYFQRALLGLENNGAADEKDKSERLRAYLDFCCLQLGRNAENSMSFPNASENKFFLDEYAVFYASYFTQCGESKTARLWVETALSQPQFIIGFNAVVMPKVLPWISEHDKFSFLILNSHHYGTLLAAYDAYKQSNRKQIIESYSLLVATFMLNSAEEISFATD